MTTTTSTKKRRTLATHTTQQGRTYLVMRDASQWMQLHEIAATIRERFGVIDSEAAISARLRDLRRHWGKTVMRKRREGSKADEYRVVTGTRPETTAMTSPRARSNRVTGDLFGDAR